MAGHCRGDILHGKTNSLSNNESWISAGKNGLNTREEMGHDLSGHLCLQSDVSADHVFECIKKDELNPLHSCVMIYSEVEQPLQYFSYSSLNYNSSYKELTFSTVGQITL